MTLRALGIAIAAYATIAAMEVIRSPLRAHERAPFSPKKDTRALQDARTVSDGVYTDEQAKRGRAIYEQHCARCHGPTLAGGEVAGPLVGPIFGANWNGVSMADMVERTKVTMPLDGPGKMSRQQIADVLAYVLSANKFPAGKTELPRQAEMLGLIKFQPLK